jgi:hypothetical protein
LQAALAHRLARGQRHLRELRVIGPDVRHLMRDDQVVLGVHGYLDVVAHESCALGLREHRARIGVGQRQLRFRLTRQLLLDLIHPAHLLAQRRDLLLQPLGLRLELAGSCSVGGL